MLKTWIYSFLVGVLVAGGLLYCILNDVGARRFKNQLKEPLPPYKKQ